MLFGCYLCCSMYCLCVNVYCQRVTTQLQLINISISYIIIFQRDGALPHCRSQVRRFLDAIFPNRWTGRDGPTPWPPRSPNITPLGFFLWGYVKDKVFSTPVPDITNLKARITDAFATITEDMLENTWRETDYRLDVLRATKGANVEVLNTSKIYL